MMSYQIDMSLSDVTKQHFQQNDLIFLSSNYKLEQHSLKNTEVGVQIIYAIYHPYFLILKQ